MKKVLLGVMIVVVIGVIAAPWVNGLMMEKAIRSQVEKTNEMYGDQPFFAKVEITNYDRGFSTSEIEWTMTFPNIQVFDGVDPVVFVEEATHGYLGVSSTTRLDRNSWYTDFVREELSGKDPLSITSKYSLLSGATVTIAVESFEIQDNQDKRLIVSPAEFVIKADREIKHILADAALEGFSIPDEIDIKGVSMHLDMNMVTRFISEGQSSFSIETVNVHDPLGNKPFALSSLNVTSALDFDEAARKLSMKADYSIGNVVADGKKADDIRLRIGVNQVDSDGFEMVVSAYEDMLGEMMADVATMQNDPEQAKAAMEQKMAFAGLTMATMMEKILKKDLNIEISNLHVTLPQGDVQGNMAIGLKKDMTLSELAVLSQQPKKMVEVFSFASSMTLPDGLVPNQDMLLVPILPGMQTGVFEKQGDKLEHRSEIKDNGLFLNGKEFAL